jgi:phospholipase/carboxylesterase
MSQDIETALTALIPRVLDTLDRLALIARHMHPPHLPELAEALGEREALLLEARTLHRAAAWPDNLAEFRHRLDTAAEHTLRACSGLRDAATRDNGVREAYRALRQTSRAMEELYALKDALETLNVWFLNPVQRDDTALLARLSARPATGGVVHVGNERADRGGFSVYFPENHDPAAAYPLVMALHGGSGHGRQFLWNWIREARGRGCVLVTPTSVGDTWSLMEPDTDIAHLDRVLTHVGEHIRIDPQRRLLTGMSDGGTFTLLAGLSDGSPFTHLAPVAASFHPMLLAMTEAERIAGLPVYLVHGALDWMFSVSTGRTASRALAAAGAAVTYREIEDLSHVYPVEENDRIVDWLFGATP